MVQQLVPAGVTPCSLIAFELLTVVKVVSLVGAPVPGIAWQIRAHEAVTGHVGGRAAISKIPTPKSSSANDNFSFERNQKSYPTSTCQLHRLKLIPVQSSSILPGITDTCWVK